MESLLSHLFSLLLLIREPGASLSRSLVSLVPKQREEGGRCSIEREREGMQRQMKREAGVQGVKERAPTLSLTPSSLHLNRRSSAAAAAAAGESPSYTERVRRDDSLFRSEKANTERRTLCRAISDDYEQMSLRPSCSSCSCRSCCVVAGRRE